MREARTNLSKLLRRVEAGEEITITRGDKPIARLVPVVLSRAAVQGVDQGRVWIADDFDAPDPALEVLFGTRTIKRTGNRKTMIRKHASPQYPQ